MFLPPNCTAILPPMDQNVIQNIKVIHRKQLLEFLLTEIQDDVVEVDISAVLKTFNKRNAVFNLDAHHGRP